MKQKVKTRIGLKIDEKPGLSIIKSKNVLWLKIFLNLSLNLYSTGGAECWKPAASEFYQGFLTWRKFDDPGTLMTRR